MKRNIITLLATIVLSSSISVLAFASENSTTVHKFGEDIKINIDSEFCEDIDLNTSDFYKVDADKNTIQYTDKNNGDVKLIFNEKIDLNDSDTVDALINSISNPEQISVYHTHKWELVGTWEQGGKSGPLYYCFGCGLTKLG